MQIQYDLGTYFKYFPVGFLGLAGVMVADCRESSRKKFKCSWRVIQTSHNDNIIHLHSCFLLGWMILWTGFVSFYKFSSIRIQRERNYFFKFLRTSLKLIQMLESTPIDVTLLHVQWPTFMISSTSTPLLRNRIHIKLSRASICKFHPSR